MRQHPFLYLEYLRFVQAETAETDAGYSRAFNELGSLDAGLAQEWRKYAEDRLPEIRPMAKPSSTGDHIVGRLSSLCKTLRVIRNEAVAVYSKLVAWALIAASGIVRKMVEFYTKLSSGFRDPKTRFNYVFGLIFILSHTWTVCLFWENRDEPGLAATWFVNQLTYSMVHWTTFAVAIGLLAVICDTEVCREFSIYREKRYVLWLVFVEVLLLAVGVYDAAYGVPDPYMLNTSSGRVEAMKEAVNLRAERTDLDKEKADNDAFKNDRVGKEAFGRKESAYKAKVEDFKKRYLDGAMNIRGKIERYNAVPIFSFALTMFFIVSLAMAIWFIYAVLPTMFAELCEEEEALRNAPTQNAGNFEKKKNRYYKFLDEIFKINILFATWLPCRYYATWYSTYYLDGGKFYFPLFILAIVELGGLVILMTLRQGYDIAVVLASITTIFGVVLTVLGLFTSHTTDVILKGFYDYLNSGIMAHLVLCAFGLMFAFAVTRIKTGQNILGNR